MTYYLLIPKKEPMIIGEMSFTKVFYTDVGWHVFVKIIEKGLSIDFIIVDDKSRELKPMAFLNKLKGVKILEN